MEFNSYQKVQLVPLSFETKTSLSPTLKVLRSLLLERENSAVPCTLQLASSLSLLLRLYIQLQQFLKIYRVRIPLDINLLIDLPLVFSFSSGGLTRHRKTSGKYGIYSKTCLSL